MSGDSSSRVLYTLSNQNLVAFMETRTPSYVLFKTRTRRSSCEDNEVKSDPEVLTGFISPTARLDLKEIGMFPS